MLKESMCKKSTETEAAPRRGITACWPMSFCNPISKAGLHIQDTPEGFPEDWMGLRPGSKTQHLHSTLQPCLIPVLADAS